MNNLLTKYDLSYFIFYLFQEREAEKLSDEGGLQVRDVKSEITPAKNLNVWHGNTFYPHLNTIKGLVNDKINI